MIGTVRGMMRSKKEVAGLPAPIASFRSNVSGVKLDSLKVLVEAQQDLHGYDSPWAGGAGKNELAMSVSNIKSLNTTGTWNGNEYTLNGVSFTIITDNAGNVTGIKVNGTATNETNFDIAEYTLKAGTSKKINGTSTQPSDSTIAYGFRGYGNVSANVDRTMTRASDVGDWNNYVYIKVYTGYNANNLMYYPMIRDASISDGTFAPYSNICPITGWSGANVTRCGVNVWDEQTKNGYYDRNNNGVFVADNSYLCSDSPIFVKPNTSYFWCITAPYTFSGRVLYFDKDGNYLSASESNVPKNTFTTPNNCYFIKWYVYKPSGWSHNNDISINYPSTDTAYHSYNGNTYTIAFGDTYYGGELDVTNGVLRVTHQIVDLGSLSWGYTNNRFYASVPVKVYSQSATPDIICECYKTTSYAQQGTEDLSCSSYAGYLYVRDTNYTIPADFKTAMNGVHLVYELATPFTIQLSPQQIAQLLGDNNVFADCGDVEEVKYLNRIDTVLFSKG